MAKFMKKKELLIFFLGKMKHSFDADEMKSNSIRVISIL